MGEEMQEILQDSSNEEYTENKHSEGRKVAIDKEADEIEESVIQVEDWRMKMLEFATASSTLNQTFSRKPGVQWK